MPEIPPLPGGMISHPLTRSPESDNAILLKKRAKPAPPPKEDQDVNNLYLQRLLIKIGVILMENGNMLRLQFSCPTLRCTISMTDQKMTKRTDRSVTLNLAFLVTLVFVFSIPYVASCADVPPFNGRLQAIIQRELPSNFVVSAQVVDLKTGRILMEKSPDLPLVPASTMKVVTSAAALQTLKPDFTFVTEVLADDVTSNSVGNLFLKGGGDPHLVSEQLFALTRELIDKGLLEIRKDIIVDDSHFAPGMPLDENEKLGHRSYHAPYSALSLNFNSIRFLVLPGLRPGESARIVMDPVSEYAVVKGDVRTVKGDKPAQVNITKETTDDDREIINIQGEIGAQAPTKGRYVNVSSPALYTGNVFKQFLLQEGVKFEGEVKRDQTPPSATPYLQFSSRPLGMLVYWLNKFSNNFMAEQVCLALGAKVHGYPGTREKGLSVVRGHLIECGVNETHFSLSEASGLSRNNRLSASALVKVLLAAARDFTYNWEFMASLGVAGVDGTLKEKFSDPGVKRRIRAKTGTLRGVNALAGYGISPEGRTFAFAVIVNSIQAGTGIVDYADKISRAILDISMDKR